MNTGWHRRPGSPVSMVANTSPEPVKLPVTFPLGTVRHMQVPLRQMLPYPATVQAPDDSDPAPLIVNDTESAFAPAVDAQSMAIIATALTSASLRIMTDLRIPDPSKR